MNRIFKHFLFVLFLSLLLPAVSHARIIHTERSLYSMILIDQRGTILCMQFSVRRDQRNQSCRDTKDPQRMVFTYSKMMMAALLFQPNPKSILVIGLGGGTVPTALAQLLPDAKINVVEIDPAVVKAAEDFFDFRETENISVIVSDGRVYAKRAIGRKEHYDLIMLDAFNGDYIPEHLMTREFLQETKQLMNPGAVLVANTFSISELYHHESTTYTAVFGGFINLKSAFSSNRVIITTPDGTPRVDNLKERAEALDTRLRPFDVKLSGYIDNFYKKPDWNTVARILTDQFSPANLLQAK
ncbi:MAG: fused MFS/spermidine synthase [Gammaproteobacteria bacterium]|nr:fused MFS/spermidine synthase [Gammaproteobacteria bacterium]